MDLAVVRSDVAGVPSPATAVKVIGRAATHLTAVKRVSLSGLSADCRSDLRAPVRPLDPLPSIPVADTLLVERAWLAQGVAGSD
jgi:hypothetical protein